MTLRRDLPDLWITSRGEMKSSQAYCFQLGDKQTSATLTCQPITDHIPAGGARPEHPREEDTCGTDCRVVAGA
jgi:hypothetical protein